MLLTVVLSLFFCLVGLAARTKPGYVEHNVTQSDGTHGTQLQHPPTQDLDLDQDFVISWHSDPTVGRLCTLKSRSCTTTDKSAIWDDCVVLKNGFEAQPGYWDVSFFQQRNLYGMLGFYGQCILSLARDDDHINDGAQISTADVTSWMTNAGRSCGVVSPGNIIRVGAKVSLDCPNTGPNGGLARLKLWIHSPDGEFNPRRAVDVPNLPGSIRPLELLTDVWNNLLLPEPRCTRGPRTCGVVEDSPIWEECRLLQQALDVHPGFWNVSDCGEQGSYSELIFSASCAVYVARPDGINQIAQISSYDVRKRLQEARKHCAEFVYPGDYRRVEAAFLDMCPNIPVAQGPQDGLAAINIWVTKHAV
ncbi:hypothetical protein PG993_014858 [Apiospora rasikravindrae]|uniref:Ecp2 effector protein-like domain-containing protein n=1 Tax=Apiospora rasikravindrae TaxID=990691 RepID=A0ABR1RQ66_9PEZI